MLTPYNIGLHYGSSKKICYWGQHYKEMISMSSLFDDLKAGLEEAISYEKGNGSAKVKTYM